MVRCFLGVSVQVFVLIIGMLNNRVTFNNLDFLQNLDLGILVT